MNDSTGSSGAPGTPRWVGVNRAEDANAPQADPTPSDAWGVRSFSPYDSVTPDYGVPSGDEITSAPATPDASLHSGEIVTEDATAPDASLQSGEILTEDAAERDAG